jgi:hypothetical protein
MENDYETKVTSNTQPYDKLSDSSSNKEKTVSHITKMTDASVGTILLACLIGLLALIIVAGIPLTQVIVGSLFKNQCPIDPHIPIYLIVSGAATLTLLITLILHVRFFLQLKIFDVFYVNGRCKRDDRMGCK